jgi:putative salt-induced outer membrane protein YdiY
MNTIFRSSLVLILCCNLAVAADLSAVDQALADTEAAEAKAQAVCKQPVKKAPGEWDLSAAFGFNLTSGNADTLLLTASGRAAREIEKDSYVLEFNGAEGEQNSVQTQRYIRGDAGYKRLLYERLYLGSSIAYIADDIADVDYRLFLSPGIGYFLLKDEEFSLNVETGPTYIFEKQGDAKENFLAARFADRFEWKFSPTGKIFQAAEILLNTDNTEDLLVNAEAGIEAALNSTLSLVFAVRDRYDNSPAVGRERNDVIITSALKVAL